MKKGLIFSLLLLIIIPSIGVAETNILNSMSFKVTVIQNGIEKEWEYTNPNEYEVEIGDSVIKGERAEQEVKEIFHHLQITEDSKVQSMVNVLKTTYKLEEIQKLDVRWINRDGELYTWVWER